IGLMVVAAMVILGIGIFIIGKRQQLFTRHTQYYSVFQDVLGLQPGAPVQLNGVTVGYVKSIELPVEAQGKGITVRFTVDARYTNRIRKDTVASIKTEGLLGDRFLKLSGGSPSAPRVLEDGLVRGTTPPELEHFLSGGEDLMENLLAISSSLRAILERAETGKGLLGQLLAPTKAGQGAGIDLVNTIASLRRITERVEAGHGLAGRMVSDDRTAKLVFDNLAATSTAIRDVAERMATDMGRDDTAWSAITRDPRGAKLLMETLTSLRDASAALAAAGRQLANGDGTLPRLLQDKEFADRFLDDLHGLVHSLRSITEKLDNGEGSAGALLNDPQLYLDLQDVVRGVQHSSLSRWYIHDRQKAGEKVLVKESEKSLRSATQQPASR
ncbi:MAG TPA: MCE family protein, partial [Acidobacteria bacterium]|nr:MCE family protein [Acidobacteriota bacterium]